MTIWNERYSCPDQNIPTLWYAWRGIIRVHSGGIFSVVGLTRWSTRDYVLFQVGFTPFDRSTCRPNTRFIRTTKFGTPKPNVVMYRYRLTNYWRESYFSFKKGNKSSEMFWTENNGEDRQYIIEKGN